MWVSKSNSRRTQGFTLIEIAIGLIVLGLITIPATMAYKIYLADKIYSESSDHITIITDALRKYAIMYGHYPIPGSRDLGPGDIGFGQAFTGVIPDCGIGTEPICRAIVGASDVLPPAGPDPVLIGDVPFAALKLPQRYITDGYGSKFTYAVAEAMTSSGTFEDSQGVINVVEKDGTVSEDRGHTVVVSHGKNRKGAYTLDGVLVAACDPPGADVENCDGDALFNDNFAIMGTGAGAIPGRYTSEIPGADYYDDFIGSSNTTRSDIWTRTANTSDIFSNPGKKIRIGPGGEPDALLDVTDGDVRALQLNATRLCDFSGCDTAVAGSPVAVPASKVFNPSIIGGTPQANFADRPGGGIDCGSKGLSGISSSDEECSNKAPNPPAGMGSCPVGATGVDASGALICF